MNELIYLRNETSKTYDLGGGRRRCVISGAVHYKDNYTDKSEQWKEIDLTFVNGRITKAPYILEVNELSIALTSKKTGTVQSLALERIGSEKSKRPVPWEFVKNQAIWKNAAPNTDIVIEAGANLVRFKRILHSANAPLEAGFAHSKVVGKIDDISLHTSARAADGEALEVAKTYIGGKLTESIDSKVDLSKVKFPIKIDPTLTVQPSAKDTQLYENAPTTNYGSDADFELCDRVGTRTYRDILEFDISELPVGATLITASLMLYYYAKEVFDPTGRTVWAYKLIRLDWVEAQATWNIYKTGSNWTAAGGDYVTSDPSGGSTTVPAGFGWMTWNVLAIVQDAYDSENSAEFLVKYENEEVVDGYTYIKFRSKEYSVNPDLQPKLVIDYTAVTPKTSSDTGSGADAKKTGNPLATYSRSETGGGVEGMPARGITLPETGSGIEHILDRSLVLISESGSGVDIVLSLLGKLRHEAGSGVDNSYLHILEGVKGSSDSGSGVEASSLAALLQRDETGEGAEAVAARALFSREPQAGAIDLARVITAAITGAETGTGAEASLMAYYQKKADSGEGVDSSTLEALFTGEDSGAGAEAITLLAAMVSHDTGVGVEAVIEFFRKLIDSGQGAENLLLVGYVGRAMKLITYLLDYSDMTVYTKPYSDLRVYTSEVKQA